MMCHGNNHVQAFVRYMLTFVQEPDNRSAADNMTVHSVFERVFDFGPLVVGNISFDAW